MASTSKDILQLAIAIAVLVGAGYLSYLFYHLANLAKESKKSVERVNTELDRVDALMDEIVPTVQGINNTVRRVHESLITPLDSLMALFKRFTNFSKED